MPGASRIAHISCNLNFTKIDKIAAKNKKRKKKETDLLKRKPKFTRRSEPPACGVADHEHYSIELPLQAVALVVLSNLNQTMNGTCPFADSIVSKREADSVFAFLKNRAQIGLKNTRAMLLS